MFFGPGKQLKVADLLEIHMQERQENGPENCK